MRKPPSNRKHVIGNIYSSNNCGKYKIIGYNRVKNTRKRIIIEFIITGYTTNVSADKIASGEIRDPYHRSLYGIGYVGDGKYNDAYKGKLGELWRGIIFRCYYQENTQYFEKCTMDKRWHNFQWFCEDISKIENFDKPNYHIDKDLIYTGNTKYGPNKCCFIPRKINNLIEGLNINPKRKYLRGVTKHYKGFQSTGSVRKTFSTEKSAYEFYVQNKLRQIKSTANKYKDKVSSVVYKALLDIEFMSYAEARRKLDRARNYHEHY